MTPRLLFIGPNRLGDAVLSTGVLAAALEKLPGAHVTVAAGPVALPVFEHVPGLERLISMKKEPRSKHWLAVWKAAVLTPWSLVIDMRGSALAYMVPTAKRWIFRSPVTAAPIHKVQQFQQAFSLTTPPTPTLWLPAAVPSATPLLILGPAANWGGKEWPLERFITLAERLLQGPLQGAQLAVVAAPDEAARVAPLLAHFPAAHSWIGQPLLTIAAQLQSAALYVGNDSGLMHLAAVSGCPTLGLFGPSDERVYAPYGPRAAWIRTPESFPDIITAPDYDYRSPRSHMLSLPLEAVLKAATLVLNGEMGSIR
jgi:heptosyltransferase III